MNLKDKLKGIPKVYYFNYKEHAHLDEHMDRNLSNLRVQNYEKVPIQYDKVNVVDWKHYLLNSKEYKLPVSTAAYAITVLEFLKNWYDNTEENELLISKDTIDFGLEVYWQFDWEYLMSKLPYDWDSLLLGFENINYIPFYLHPIMPAHTFGISMLNRRYVKKLLRLHCVGEKYNLTNYIANKNYGLKSGTVDYFLGHCGKTYCFPMFPNHTDFFDKTTKRYVITKASRLAYYDWWRNDSKRHSFDEIFTYGKQNDVGMIKKVSKYF